MSVRCVVFDLDGTLLYTLEDMTVSLNKALSRFGYPAKTREEARGFIGNGVRRLVERSVPGGAENPDFESVFREYNRFYARHSMDHVRPYEGIPAMLSALREMDYPTAVVSNKPHEDALPMVRHFFGNLISVTVGNKGGVPPKPAPNATLEALSMLGCKPEEALYVGDSEVDAQTARNAGTACLLVSWGYRERPVLEAQEPLGILDTPGELLTFLGAPTSPRSRKGEI